MHGKHDFKRLPTPSSESEFLILMSRHRYLLSTGASFVVKMGNGISFASKECQQSSK